MKYLLYFNENKTNLSKIGNDIYISSDIEELPSNSLIVKHNYDEDIKSGELGLFCSNLEQENKHGKNTVYISIGKKANIVSIDSTEDYLMDKKLFYSENSYLKDKYKNIKIYPNNSIKSFYDLFSLESDIVFYEMQKEVIKLLPKNVDILEMRYEDDVTPHQYLIISNPYLLLYKPNFTAHRNKDITKNL